MNMKKSLFILLSFMPAFTHSQHVPTFEEVISLRNAGGARLSPDGRHVAFTVQTTDWHNNRYDTEIWLSAEGKKPYQFTNTDHNNSINPAFSPDGEWLAFIADRGNKNQVYAMRLAGGEARAVTDEEDGITSFAWHPSGDSFIFLKPEHEERSKKEREKRYGAFETNEREYTLSHLWQIDFKPDAPETWERPCYETADSLRARAGCIECPRATRLTGGRFTVMSFVVSPDGSTVAFGHQPDPLANTFLRSDISLIDLVSKKITPLITNASSDALEDWSPDSKSVLYITNLADTTSNFYVNSKLFVIDVPSKKTRQLAVDLDEDVAGFTWNATGIYTSQWNKTKRPVYRIDPATGKYGMLGNLPEQVYGMSFSKKGDRFAFTGRNGNQLTEVFVTPTVSPRPLQLTSMTGQIAGWKTAQSEVISWKSKDGAMIEGVLHKPKDYDPSRKYPLMVIIHGGPTAIDTPYPAPGYVYPILQWLNKGCLVLRPNYRGSAGYGEAFRALNVKNLGIGDTWDVLAGIDFLDSKGLIDKSKMGCMGWSQGGYISAFLTTNTDIFKAISVGAGISNWTTYYVGTDIHLFTRQYLKSTPWADEAIYKKTSPMTTIAQAKTPTLIQHGEFDKRVPISNAYELLQGLRDQGVDSELIIYKGFGHGISKPKERLAATWHNWQWFNKYIWNEEITLPLGK